MTFLWPHLCTSLRGKTSTDVSRQSETHRIVEGIQGYGIILQKSCLLKICRGKTIPLTLKTREKEKVLLIYLFISGKL
jgi:hypothetical protein